MTPCEQVTERMVAVAHGAGAFTGEEAAHLAACPDCALEWRLVQAAGRLGGREAARVDPARVSDAVLGELRAERRRHQWIRRGALAGLAAAAALVLMVRTGGRAPTPGGELPGVATAGLYVPLAELESLDEGQLEAVLEGLEAPLTEGGAVAPPALGDLDDAQLERVLRSLEG